MGKFLVTLVMLALIGAAAYTIFFNNSGTGESYGTVTINNKIFRVELADTPAKRTKGLSGRDNVGAADGMLFIFETPAVYPFWMKDMRFPIDIIWIKDDRVVGISDVLRPSKEQTPPAYSPPDAVNYVLELPAGYAGKYTIDKDARVTINLTTAK